MALSGTSHDVLRRFIDGANAQYRAAGLDRHQLRLRADGSVEVPRSETGFRAPAPTAPAAGAAVAGAAAVQPAGVAPAGSAPAAASGRAPASGAAAPAGPPPTISGLQRSGNEAFRIAWQPVAGATAYGIWQDGALIGHVTEPAFAAKVAAGSSGAFQVDALLDQGRRTARTAPIVVRRGADGALQVGPGSAAASARAGAAASGATAPAAAAG